MNLANKISIARIILIPFFITAVAYDRMDIALAIFIAAVITDGADGFIARTRGEKTKLGTIIDPLADKFLLISAFICLAVMKTIPQNLRLPPYVPIIVISRDVIIVLGSIMVHIITGDIRVAPSAVGKITTFFQMMAIVSILAQYRYSPFIWNIAVILTVISGIDYIRKGSRLLSENHNASRRTV